MPRDSEELSEASWAMLDEGLTTGQMTLPSGKVVTLDPTNFIRIVQWLATLKPRKPQGFQKPEDFAAPVTIGKEAKSEGKPS